jgi:surface antigen/LysM repeat protein
MGTIMALPNLPAKFDKLDKKSRRRTIRWAIVAGNFLLLLLIGAFLLVNHSASQTVRSSTANSIVGTASSVQNPLDQLSSDQIALVAAQMTNLPELTMVRNRADSTAILLAQVPNDSTTLAKPQVVTTAEKSRYDIIHYTVAAGDSVTSLATKFGVSTNSIKWSNGLSSDNLTAGASLLIPPAEGVVYQVKSTDTAATITNKYQANLDTFVTVNDAEGGVSTGELVWIPNGVQPVLVNIPTLTILTGASSGTFSGAHRYNSCSLGVNNGYDCGWCTWWAAFRRAQVGAPVPANWGDAYTWAAAAGNRVTLSPAAGDVIWFPYDHVGFVEGVNSDGSITISEMNQEGWDVVDYRNISADQIGNFRYIN